MLIVSNTSPLIILYKCGHLTLLRDLFGQVLIPEAVYQEVVHNTQDRQQSDTIARCDFIEVQSVVLDPDIFSHRLDLGELEAIMLSIQKKADYLILDDKNCEHLVL